MALRMITAGESHGPGLTCIIEGMPPGCSSTATRSTRDLARRQLGHGRGGRMKIETRPCRGDGRRAPRPHARRADRAAGRQPRLRQLGGADEPVAGRRRRSPRSTCRGPVTPTSSAPRSTASAMCATSSSAPARVRRLPASPAARWRKEFLRALGVAVSSRMCSRSRASPRPGATICSPRTSPTSTRRRCAAWTPGRPRDGRRDRHAAQGERVARRRVRGSRVRARARPRFARLLARSASTARLAQAIVSIQAIKAVVDR